MILPDLGAQKWSQPLSCPPSALGQSTLPMAELVQGCLTLTFTKTPSSFPEVAHENKNKPRKRPTAERDRGWEVPVALFPWGSSPVTSGAM